MAEETKAVNALTERELESVSGGHKIEVIGSGNVWVLDTARADGGIVTTLHRGDIVEYGNETKFDQYGNPAWFSVIINGRVGWIPAKKTRMWND